MKILTKSKQVASSILMVRPNGFSFNPLTAVDNVFMTRPEVDPKEITRNALNEYDRSVELLRENGVFVVSFDRSNYLDIANLHLPDAVFTTDHFSTWANGDITTYPLKAENRELEKKTHKYMFELISQSGFHVGKVEAFERDQPIDALESTGTILIDRVNNISYVATSARGTPNMVEKWGKKYNQECVTFRAFDNNNIELYHTTMLLVITDNFVIVCTEFIQPKDKERVLSSLRSSGREIIEITMEQALKGKLGNCLGLQSNTGESLIVMSERAQRHLTKKQKEQIEVHSRIIALPLKSIEEVGGGSARCMIGEIFNPIKALL